MDASKLRRSHLAFAIVAVVSLCRPSAVWAQCTPQEQSLDSIKDTPGPGAPFRLLDRLNSADCLGGAMDSTPIAASVRKALEVPPDDSTLFTPAAAGALGLIDEHLTKTMTPSSHDVLRDLKRQVGLARGILGSGSLPAQPTAWELDGGRIFVLTLPLQPLVDNACAMRDATCSMAFDAVKEVLRLARLTRLALLTSESPRLKGLLAENMKRAKQWDEYFSGARSQYLWELAVNGARMKDTRQDVMPEVMAAPGIKAVPAVKGGFRDVPRDQIMFLHPTVAMEYADAEAEGNKFNATVLVDVVGYNRWSWKPDGSMGFAIGGSLIFAASDHALTDDFALGFMVHVNHQWSVGVVFGGDDPTLVVSGDVAQLWTKVSALRKTKMMTGK